MIDPKELRIGNYFLDDDGKTCKLNGFKPLDHLTRCDSEDGCLLLFDFCDGNFSGNLNWEYESDLCSPIPLTEEWLLQFGFEIYASSSVVDGWCIGENPITHDYLFDLKWMKNEDGSLAECFYKNGYFVMKYVHSLQNLYFALTGKELELKPEL